MKKILYALLLLSSSTLFANEVKIVKVKAICDEDRVCRFDVTLKHKDTGWKHYANKWEIYTLDNKLLASRTLYHPHVKEQPFTRSIRGVKIAKNIKSVLVKAYDSKHGLSNKVYKYTF